VHDREDAESGEDEAGPDHGQIDPAHEGRPE
jgi:hypothetical protein